MRATITHSGTSPVLPTVQDGLRPPLNLPSDATLNPDGSVTLDLCHPFSLKLRSGADSPDYVWDFDQVLLHRLSGGNVRRVIAAPNSLRVAMAFSLRVSLKELLRIESVMDARDERAARDIVSELLGGMRMELPEYVERTPAGVLLPIVQPIRDANGELCREILFRPITAAQRRQIAKSSSILDWGLALSAGMPPKSAMALVDAADGADAMAMNMVVLFVCGILKGHS